MVKNSFFHVRLEVERQRHDEVKLDLSESELEEQFLQPYRTGRPIIINGRQVKMEDLKRIRISRGLHSRDLIARVEVAERQSAVAIIGGPSKKWRAAAMAEDVTDQFITGPPGGFTNESQHIPPPLSSMVTSVQGPGDRNSVFLVYGRDSAASAAMKSFLRSLHLRVVEWEHAVNRVGTPNPYIGEVVFAGLRMADAAVVLLTPDDLVKLRDDLVQDSDNSHEREVRGQARPNVIYEAGVADTIGRERTILVEVGQVKSFSDVSGRLSVRYDGSSSSRHTLVQRLKLAGLQVDVEGIDWLSAGDIESTIKAAQEAHQKNL